MLESRNSYGWGMVSPPGKGWDWRIKKDGCGTLLGGRPHKTKNQAMKDAKDFVSSSKYWNGASIEVIPYEAYSGY